MKSIMGGTAIIIFEEDGELKNWGIGCLIRHPTIPPDTPATIKEHLKRWRPNAKFFGVRFIPDDPEERSQENERA